MTDLDIAALVSRHGATGKLVRAICAARGWRWDKNGAPPQWYAAYAGDVGAAIEHALERRKEKP